MADFLASEDDERKHRGEKFLFQSFLSPSVSLFNLGCIFSFVKPSKRELVENTTNAATIASNEKKFSDRNKKMARMEMDGCRVDEKTKRA